MHAGMYLMLRIAETYGLPLVCSLAMVLVGALSVWYATIVGGIQSDAKSVLAYASMAQVGLMFIEIGIGLHSLAIFHFVSHSMLRTYQLLNAASLMHERYAFEHVLGREMIAFHPVSGRRGLRRYAYAFWESIDGAFGRLSLLVLAEYAARKTRSFEEYYGELILTLVRHVMFYFRHPIRSLSISFHRINSKGD